MTNQEIIRDNIQDMLGVEQHILQAVERQMRDSRISNYPSAYEMIRKIESILSSHVFTLERCLATVDGGYETKIKKAATTLFGTVTGLYDRIRTDEPVSKNLRDDYTSLNLAVISYGMLHTTALAVNDSEVAQMAFRHLCQLTPLVVQLSDLIPLVLTKELSAEGKVQNTTVAGEAVRDMQKAWSHEHVRVIQ